MLFFFIAVAAGSSQCVVWETVRAGTIPPTTLFPGQQSNAPLGVCRAPDNCDTNSTVQRLGKLEHEDICYFVCDGTPEQQKKHKNGTNKERYDVATLADPDTCHVEWPIWYPGLENAPNLLVSDSRPDGTIVGPCMVPGGAGSHNKITGEMLLRPNGSISCSYSSSHLRVTLAEPWTFAVGLVVQNGTNQTHPMPPPLAPLVFAARLSYTDVHTTVRLTFDTVNTTDSSYAAVVRWGTRPGSYSSEASGTTSDKRTCYTLAPKQHWLDMIGLQPSTRYYYTFGDKARGMSKEYNFVSAPAPGDSTTSNIVIFGDMGLDYSESTRKILLQLALDEKYDFIVHNGDIAYANNRIFYNGGDIYQTWMDVWFAEVSRFAVLRPYMFSPGNHENVCDYMEYEQRAGRSMPFDEDPQYYAYTRGNVRIISLSGEGKRLESVDTPEFKWMEQALAAASALRANGTVSWIFTHVHYPNAPSPPYCTSVHDYCCGKAGCEVTPAQAKAEELFEKHGVDLHFTAHEHLYERTAPVYKFEPAAGARDDEFVDPPHTINVVCGSAGNQELQHEWIEPRPEWSVGIRTNEFGFLNVTVYNDSVLEVRYVESLNGTVLDTFRIVKTAGQGDPEGNLLRKRA